MATSPPDLVFRAGPAAAGALVFGAQDDPRDLTGRIAGRVVLLRGRVPVGSGNFARFGGVLKPLRGPVHAEYASDTYRPTVSGVTGRHQNARSAPAGAEQRHQVAQRLRPSGAASWGLGAPLRASTTPAHGQAAHRQQRSDPRHQDAAWMAGALLARHQEMARAHIAQGGRYQEAAPVRARSAMPWQDRFRDRRPALALRWGEALPRHIAREALAGDGTALGRALGGRYQDARRPLSGVWVPPPRPTGPTGCYVPSPHLVFFQPPALSAALLFSCAGPRGGGTDPVIDPPEGLIVIPLRTVYLVNNSVILRRTDTGVAYEVEDASMQIDADSWAWGFSASLPYASLAAMLPAGGEPLVVDLIVNGAPYRMLVESIATERTFTRTSLRVGGRSLNARLADPYAATRNFSIASALTAQQVALEALTENGVGIGWAIDWRLTDWLVPPQAWSHRGTHMSAVLAIAQAVGGYVQPHPTAQTLRVLHRYPTMPWEWATTVPDVVVPSAVAEVESIEYVDRPFYNRVFVHGQEGGVLARVTRAGTAGDAVAPTQVDALITHDDAARQRARAVLGDTGRQAAVTLSMPVLSASGVISPGKLVRYADGSTLRTGLVRATSVQGGLSMRQTLSIETHVPA